MCLFPTFLISFALLKSHNTTHFATSSSLIFSLSMHHILLLGDSLTQQGYGSGWVSSLSDRYIRRADVLNRGLSGYNSRWVLDILKDDKRRQFLLPPSIGRPLFVTLMLGSNDATRKAQNVPLLEYKKNIKEIIAIVRKHANPVGGIFLLTPPPVDEEKRLERMREFQNIETVSDRTFDTMREYRNAAIQIGSEEKRMHGDVTIVDLFQIFLGSKADTMTYSMAPWCENFIDGLHFNTKGAAILFEALWDAIKNSPAADRLLPERIPYVLPPHESLWRASE